MLARGVALVALAAAAALACGGKTDNGSTGVASAPPPPGTSPPGPPALPARPPTSDVTPIASDIAAAYCTTFGDCCSGMGLLPIDAARCREVMVRAITPSLAEAAIAKRTAACSVLLTGEEATSPADEACTPPATTCLSGVACLIDTCTPAGRLDDACTPSNPRSNPGLYVEGIFTTL